MNMIQYDILLLQISLKVAFHLIVSYQIFPTSAASKTPIMLKRLIQIWMCYVYKHVMCVNSYQERCICAEWQLDPRNIINIDKIRVMRLDIIYYMGKEMYSMYQKVLNSFR